MTIGEDLMPQPPETFLPDEPEPRAALESGVDPAAVAAAHPTSSAVWAVLADRAFAAGETIASYAYARTGYHRGLDQLRRAGWKGHGPVPWDHEPNQGFLRCVYALGRAAGQIGEAEEAERCQVLLRDSSEEAAEVLGGS